MIAAGLIVGGYIWLIATCGWPGVVVAAVHALVMIFSARA